MQIGNVYNIYNRLWFNRPTSIADFVGNWKIIQYINSLLLLFKIFASQILTSNFMLISCDTSRKVYEIFNFVLTLQNLKAWSCHVLWFLNSDYLWNNCVFLTILYCSIMIYCTQGKDPISIHLLYWIFSSWNPN